MLEQTPIQSPKIDQPELNRIIEALKKRQFEAPPGDGGFRPLPSSKTRRAAAKKVESIMAKAGLNVRAINKKLVADQKALQSAFDKQREEAAGRFPAEDQVFRSGMAVQLEALKVLGKPFVGHYVTLDRPFWISELANPVPGVSFSSQIESMRSSVRILVETNNGSQGMYFGFHYLWENESDFYTVANVSTSLVLHGACSVAAASGVFSGDEATVSIGSWLRLFRWSGWGTDPMTGESNNQTYYPHDQLSQYQLGMAYLHAAGGGIFGDPDFASQSFLFQPFPFSHSLFIAPGKSYTVFEVILRVNYGFEDGFTIPDKVTIDFANNGNAIICPSLVLQILTPVEN